MDEKDFIAELQQEFFNNLSFEYSTIEEILLNYEKSNDGQAIVELLRVLHSMKGSAHAAELPEAAKYIHLLESAAVVQKQKPIPIPEFVTFILKHLDELKNRLKNQLEKSAA